MKVILKQSIPILKTRYIVEFAMPRDAKVLSIANQNESLTVWYESDDRSLFDIVQRKIVRFELVMTGQVCTLAGEFKGTLLFDNGKYVIHVYQLLG